MAATIYHNPACGTSRKVLAMLREAGAKPRVIEYLKTPPARGELADLIARAGLRPRDVLRKRGTPCEALGLDDPSLSDDAILDALMAHPILIERPFVATERGVRLCRPADRVKEIL